MKLSTTISLIFSLLFAMLILMGPNLARAQTCPANTICIENPIQANNIEEVINSLIDLLNIVVLPLGMVMIIWGGIQILTAAGSEDKLTQGKKTIIWAVVGLAIVYAVRFIVGIIQELLQS